MGKKKNKRSGQGTPNENRDEFDDYDERQAYDEERFPEDDDEDFEGGRAQFDLDRWDEDQDEGHYKRKGHGPFDFNRGRSSNNRRRFTVELESTEEEE
ncbi:MAG: hypothetical protein ACI8TQ_002991 [Planctomycetota bacterium]|jgi:hypothetical protein